MHVNRRFLFGGMSSSLILSACNAPSTVEVSNSASIATLKNQIYSSVNNERRRRGRGSLSRNRKLEIAATKFAIDLDRRKYGVGRDRIAFKAHGANKVAEVKRRASSEGYRIRIIGENVGYFQEPSRVIPGWASSREHSSIMFYEKMQDMGLGISGKVYVLMLGAEMRR